MDKKTEPIETAVVLLGTRGTLPVHGREFDIYGGATSCVLVCLGGERIFLDAGSGMMGGETYLSSDHFSILLSHAHADHLIGLPVFAPLFDHRYRADIYAADRQGLPVKEQIRRLMSPPLWPIAPEAFSPQTGFLPISERFTIGDVEVRTMEGNHPGGVSVYRLAYGGKTIVHCTDFEHGPRYSAELAEFAADCDILFYDAQFSDQEYESRHGWGHSTWNEGVKAAERCRAARLVFVHHAPTRTDAELLGIEAAFKNKAVSFGRCGEEIYL